MRTLSLPLASFFLVLFSSAIPRLSLAASNQKIYAKCCVRYGWIDLSGRRRSKIPTECEDEDVPYRLPKNATEVAHCINYLDAGKLQGTSSYLLTEETAEACKTDFNCMHLLHTCVRVDCTPCPSESPHLAPTWDPTSGPSVSPSHDPSLLPSGAPSGGPTMSPTFDPTGEPSTMPSRSPTAGPSHSPSKYPTANPTWSPTNDPTQMPTFEPTADPTATPSEDPTRMPTHAPSTSPSREPSTDPTSDPTASPSNGPSMSPSAHPSAGPSRSPSDQPSLDPTNSPSRSPSQYPSVLPSHIPTSSPSMEPTSGPTSHPSGVPSESPTASPSYDPSGAPSTAPSRSPTAHPSGEPTHSPSDDPSANPTQSPTRLPSRHPSVVPSATPTTSPSSDPSSEPTSHPSGLPSGSPTRSPSRDPSDSPSVSPSQSPTAQPSAQPTSGPSAQPTEHPTWSPTNDPTQMPTFEPTSQPTVSPSADPSAQPTLDPTATPTRYPSAFPSTNPTTTPTWTPSVHPSSTPSTGPTLQPTLPPSRYPSEDPTSNPTSGPTGQPTVHPSSSPTQRPTGNPTHNPTAEPSSTPTDLPTSYPSAAPSRQPSESPTETPSTSPYHGPSLDPTVGPTTSPSSHPTVNPSTSPTHAPSNLPSVTPSTSPSHTPTRSPTTNPTGAPSSYPSASPSRTPTAHPTKKPSGQPSLSPTKTPSDSPTTQPSARPSRTPTAFPSGTPSEYPTESPTLYPSGAPSVDPSRAPSTTPSVSPAVQPARDPTGSPVPGIGHFPVPNPTDNPTPRPSLSPSARPTEWGCATDDRTSSDADYAQQCSGLADNWQLSHALRAVLYEDGPNPAQMTVDTAVTPFKGQLLFTHLLEDLSGFAECDGVDGSFPHDCKDRVFVGHMEGVHKLRTGVRGGSDFIFVDDHLPHHKHESSWTVLDTCQLPPANVDVLSEATPTVPSSGPLELTNYQPYLAVQFLVVARGADPQAFFREFDQLITGEIVAWAGSSTASAEVFVSCDGAALHKSEYPDLWDAIGETYGTADADRFLLPDCRGRTLAYVRNLTDAPLDELYGGEAEVNLSARNLAPHAHFEHQLDLDGAECVVNLTYEEWPSEQSGDCLDADNRMPWIGAVFGLYAEHGANTNPRRGRVPGLLYTFATSLPSGYAHHEGFAEGEVIYATNDSTLVDAMRGSDDIACADLCAPHTHPVVINCADTPPLPPTPPQNESSKDNCTEEGNRRDGHWGSWSNWTECCPWQMDRGLPVANHGGFLSCPSMPVSQQHGIAGFGFAAKKLRFRTRECDSPTPQCGGCECRGEAVQVEPCAADCEARWSEWGEWTLCEPVLGACNVSDSLQAGISCRGVQWRERFCVGRSPRNDARCSFECSGEFTDVRQCSTSDCFHVDVQVASAEDWKNVQWTLRLGHDVVHSYGVGQDCAAQTEMCRVVRRGLCYTLEIATPPGSNATWGFQRQETGAWINAATPSTAVQVFPVCIPAKSLFI